MVDVQGYHAMYFFHFAQIHMYLKCDVPPSEQAG